MSTTGHPFTLPRYRTPADVRAIPNATWEAWVTGGGVPFGDFSAERWTQRTMRDGLTATRRRVGE